MPHIDKRNGHIVLRIVYDGAPEAGKTTNLHQLRERMSLKRRGKVESPGSRGQRTEFFDWLDFDDSDIDGSTVRCQIVSVPGQSALLRRRKYLLRDADAVVFVADSTPSKLDNTRSAYQLLERAFSRLDNSLPVPIVLQANKQDCADALDAATLREQLDANPNFPVLPTQANIGQGVMETFLTAVRLATERIQDLMLRGELDDPQAGDDSPEALYKSMLASEQLLLDNHACADSESSAESATPTASNGAMAHLAESEFSFQTDSAAVGDASASSPLATAPDTIPLAASVPAGCFWPPVLGRNILDEINQLGASRSDSTMPWAPKDACEFRVRDRWLLHTRADWAYETLEKARLALMYTVRDYAREALDIPEGRTLFVANDGLVWRQWMISPVVKTLEDRLRSVLTTSDSNGIAEVLEETVMAVAEIVRRTPKPLPFLGLKQVAVVEGKVWELGLPGTPRQAPISEKGATAELKELVVEVIQGDRARTLCFRDAIAMINKRKEHAEK